MKESIALTKSEDFGVRIMNLYEYLKEKKAPFRIIEQVIASGTSIGANLFEARYGISDKDFLAKVHISLKEGSETLYWLRILKRTNYLTENQFNSLNSDGEEIMKILTATAKTLKSKLNIN